ncbi:MAG: sulfatase-like hydrolase/transferase [Planctomycetaceae bacterium]
MTLKTRVLWGIFAIGLLAVAVLGLSVRLSSPTVNVLMITLDTTRADRIGCYGDASALTPTLDALASRGVLFEQALTPAPLTLPSHASMMTGLHPPEHGLTTNGRGRLNDELPTLAEALRDAGYETGAFVGSFVLHSKFGLTQGFDQYNDDMTHTDPTEHGLHRQRDGLRVIDAALEWLQLPRKKPFFCWVHLYDPHFPYVAHADTFGDRFQNDPYGGEIAYVDQQINRLMLFLQQQQLSDQTLVVIVGDHGESLGEHHELEHGMTLYHGALRVPWIWAGPGVTAVGRREPALVSLVDFAPTLLETVGVEMQGTVSGRSLQPALAGQQIPSRDCYSATDDPLLELGCSPIRGLISQDWKYIRSPIVELYNLKDDPGEARNLAATEQERTRQMESALSSLEHSMTRRESADVELSPQEQRVLASLGYLGGQSETDENKKSEVQLPDIKQILPLHNTTEEAHQKLIDGDAPTAEKMLRVILRESPEYLPAQIFLAESLTKQHKLSESRELLESVIQHDPEEEDAYFQLGLIELAENRREEAVKHFRKALEIKPDAIGALYNLGLTLSQLGQLQLARQCYEKAIVLDPAYVNAHIALGLALAMQQRPDDAMEHYRIALSYDAKAVEAHSNLAVLLAGQQKLEEAGEHFAKAVELAPDNAETHFNYGTYLMSMRRFEPAIQELSEAIRLNPNHPQASDRLQLVRQMQSQ